MRVTGSPSCTPGGVFRVDVDDPSASARVAIVMFGLVALLFAMSLYDDYRAGTVDFGYLEAGYLAILGYYVLRVVLHTGGGALPWRRHRYVALDDDRVAWRLGGIIRRETAVPRDRVRCVEIGADDVRLHLRTGESVRLVLADLPFAKRRAIREGFAAARRLFDPAQ